MSEKTVEQMGLLEMRELVRRQISPDDWEHIMGAAESGATLRRNQSAFRQWLFRQKIFHDVRDPDLSVELFGRRLSLPTMVAPLGSFNRTAARGERDVAEGASSVGTMIFVSHAAKADVREWAHWATAPLVFMGYLSRGRDQLAEYAHLAEELNYAAVGLTMDGIQPTKLGEHFPLTAEGKPRTGHPASPKDIEWLKRQVSLPMVVKGIMSAEDARTAVEAGADCLVVSNHGARLLDFNRAAVEALSEVVDAVGSRVPILFDSGVRRGGDAVKALALGAKGVLLGRPLCWGAGAGGVKGVQRVFEIFREEMRRVLVMTGVAAVSELTPSILIPA